MNFREDFSYKKEGDGHIATSCGTILVLVRFKLGGNLRFLSHAETLRVFQRACVRAGFETVYTQGFNPRPKLSLPLPRSVGVASDDELFCLLVRSGQQADVTSEVVELNRPGELPFDAEGFMARLSGQLPDGCELFGVSIAETKAMPQPVGATYVLEVRPEYFNEELKVCSKRVMAAENLGLKRRVDAKGNIRDVDVRGYLSSIVLDDRGVKVECKISPAGSIRVEEILQLLGLDAEKLAAPVRRTNVKWQQADN